MGSVADQIELSLIYCGEEHRVRTFWGEYRNLRDLINDKLFVDNFGECRGMGRCGTCTVTLQSDNPELQLRKRNEESTLMKAGIQHAHIRLACQILIDGDIKGARINVSTDD